jgi:hypothetical protein
MDSHVSASHQCPLLAQSGHRAALCQCPASHVIPVTHERARLRQQSRRLVSCANGFALVPLNLTVRPTSHGIGREVGRVGEEPRTTSPTNEAYSLLEPSTVSYRTLAIHG